MKGKANIKCKVKRYSLIWCIDEDRLNKINERKLLQHNEYTLIVLDAESINKVLSFSYKNRFMLNANKQPNKHVCTRAFTIKS